MLRAEVAVRMAVLAAAEPGPWWPPAHPLAVSAIPQSLWEGSALLLGCRERCPKL